jgi:hypothetical protein
VRFLFQHPIELHPDDGIPVVHVALRLTALSCSDVYAAATGA